jgi:hypothetical protein
VSALINTVVEEVGLDAAGHLFVKPQPPEDFTHIWRDASGVRWNAASRTLVGYEPERWEPVNLLQQIVAAVKSEYGRVLLINGNTKWPNIAPALKEKLENAI